MKQIRSNPLSLLILTTLIAFLIVPFFGNPELLAQSKKGSKEKKYRVITHSGASKTLISKLSKELERSEASSLKLGEFFYEPKNKNKKYYAFLHDKSLALLVPRKLYFKDLKNLLKDINKKGLTYTDIVVTFPIKKVHDLKIIETKDIKELFNSVYFLNSTLKKQVLNYYDKFTLPLELKTGLPQAKTDNYILVAPQGSDDKLKKHYGHKYAGKRIILIKRKNGQALIQSYQDFKKDIEPLINSIKDLH